MTNTAFFANHGGDICGKFALERNVSLLEMGDLGNMGLNISDLFFGAVFFYSVLFPNNYAIRNFTGKIAAFLTYR